MRFDDIARDFHLVPFKSRSLILVNQNIHHVFYYNIKT